MSDIDVGVGFDGLEEAAARLREAAGELRDLGTASQETSAAVARFEAAIEAETRSLRELRSQATAASASKTRLTQGTSSATQAATEAGRRWGEVAGAMGNVGAVAGTLSPQMGQLGGVIGAVGSASGALSSSMGPLGVAIAGVTTAVGLYSIAAQAQREQMERQQRAVQDLARDFRQLAGDIQGAIDRSADLSLIRRGLGSSADTMGRAQELRNRQRLIQQAMGGNISALEQLRGEGITGESQGANRSAGSAILGTLIGDRRAGHGTATAGEQTALRAALTATTRELQVTTRALETVTARDQEGAARAQADVEGLRGGLDGRRSGSRGGGESNLRGGARTMDEAIFNAEAEYQEALMRGRERQAQRQIELNREIAEEANKAAEERMAAERDAAAYRDLQAQKELEDIQRAHEARLEAIDKEKEAARIAQEARAATMREVTGTIETQLVRVAGLFQDAFDAAIKGEKSFEEALAEGSVLLLKQLGEELVAKGIGSVLEGFTMTVTNPPGAATKIGGGIAMIAFGASLGAAAAAIPSASAAPVEGPADPRDTSEPTAEDSGPRELTLIFNSPIQTAQTNAALARQMRRQLAAGQGFTPGGS